jgi:hypothetical protein
MSELSSPPITLAVLALCCQMTNNIYEVGNKVEMGFVDQTGGSTTTVFVPLIRPIVVTASFVYVFVKVAITEGGRAVGRLQRTQRYEN